MISLDMIEDLISLFNNQFDNFDASVDKFTFNVEQYSQFQSFANTTFMKVEVSNTTSVTDLENASLLVFNEVLDEESLKVKLAELGVGDRSVFIQYLNAENNSVLVFSQSSEINILQTFNSQVTLDANNFSFVTGTTNGEGNDVFITTVDDDDNDNDDNDDDDENDDNDDDDENDDNDDDDENDDNDDDNENDDNDDDNENDDNDDDRGLNIKGTKGDDQLEGNQGDDNIRGDDGNDTIIANGGDDRINAGKGSDLIFGGPGDDDIKADRGNDTIIGGAGSDKIKGDKDPDYIVYTSLQQGTDRLEDFSKDDKLVFNRSVFGNFNSANFTSVQVSANTREIGNASFLIFDDRGQNKNLNLSQVLDRLDDLDVGDRPVFVQFSERGRDDKLVFVQGETVDEIATLKNKTELEARNFLFVRMTDDGEVDEEPLLGTDGDDSLNGSDDSDTCYGGSGGDTLNGGGGGDTFIYFNINEGGDTIINFNINIDVLQFNSRSFGNITNQNFQSIVINNSTTNIGNANFLIFNQEIDVEQLLARLTELGVNRQPVFVTVPSDDDDQTVLYFVQNQEVNIVANFNQNLVLNVNNFNFNNETSVPGNQIIGTANRDVLNGTLGNDTMTGLAGNDRMSGNNGNDSLLGGAGNDVLSGDAGNDSLFGNEGNDKLYGKDGNDSLSGGHGFDHLFGGEGNDVLLGGTGGDRLNGGAGNDSLIGGGGKDRFIFNTNEPFRPSDFGIDRITDFTVGEDLILLDQRSFNGLNSVAGIGFSVATEFAVVNNADAVARSAALIVYNQNTGELFYNQNGSANGFGTGGQFAVLENKAVLTAESFQMRVV